MATYSVHYDYNGSTCTLEWRDASPGGTVFLSVEKWVDPDHTIIPFLAYDLRKTPNATPGTLWNMGTQVGTQYVERGADVMISCTNYPFHDSSNVRDYDIYLDNSTTTYVPSSYPYVAREYWDAHPDVPPIYVGVNGKARQVTDMYVGVNGKARKVKAIYVGVNGRAREVFKAT